MKKILKIALTMMASVAALTSCHDKDDYDPSLYYANMIVTVKTADNGQQFFQLDDKTTLLPVNIDKPLFGGKQVRAFANCQETKDNSGSYTKAVNVNWIDSILTKKPVVSEGAEEDKNKYGDAPIAIENHWATIVEDNYVTLCFTALWGDYTKVHYLNLVTGTDPEDPYTLEFRHDARDDAFAYGNGRPYSGFVAFDISGLPDTEGKTVKLKIKYKSFYADGDRTVEFDYCTGKTARTSVADGVSYQTSLPIR